MKYYEVSGQQFLTQEQVADLISKMEQPYFREHGERGVGRPITPDDTFEDAWIDILVIFRKENKALEYARKTMKESLDGGYAVVKKVKQKFLSSKLKHSIICEVKKENGKIVEIRK